MTKPVLKVLHVGKFYPPDLGGIERVTQDLVRGTNSVSPTIKADVLCFASGRRTRVEYVDGAVVHRVGVWITLSSAPISLRYLWWFWRLQGKYDVLHVHYPNPLAILAILMTRGHRRTVLHWHSDVVGKSIGVGFNNQIIKLIGGHVGVVVGATPAHVGETDVSRLLKGTPTSVIPYMAPRSATHRSQPAVRLLGYGVSQEKYRVLSVGRLVPYKGFAFLIDSAQLLDDRYEFLIVGDGPLRAHLIAKSNQLNSRVRLVGAVDELTKEALYESADVFCLPSIERGEMFGMVMLEAFSFGLPVVSTDIPRSGVKHVNHHERTGLVVRPRDPSALASAISRICENHELHQKFGQNAIESIKKTYSQEVVISSFIGIYERIRSLNCISRPVAKQNHGRSRN